MHSTDENMIPLTRTSIDAYLTPLQLQIGSWNQVEVAGPAPADCVVTYATPVPAAELFVFSQHLASWLAPGDWTILQIDNSTAFTDAEVAFVSAFAPTAASFGPDGNPKDGDRSLLLRSVPDASSFRYRVANVIHAFLLHEGHAQLASPGLPHRHYLSLQDGVAELHCQVSSKAFVESMLTEFERDPLAYPMAGRR